MRRSNEIDFDHWLELARTDPDGFETRRRQTIEAAIAQAPPVCRQRLRCLQWRIDQIRRRSGTPLAACISLSNMMWKSLMGNRGLLSALRGLESEHARPLGGARAAKIIPLRRE